MSPHSKGKEQAPVTLKNISGEKKNSNNKNKAYAEVVAGRGGGEGENGWKNLVGWKKKKTARGKTGRANESHDRCSELLGMRMPKDRWPQALKALLVVNFFKLHLNAYKALFSG